MTTAAEYAANDSISYIKVWITMKDSLILGAICYIFSPCYQSVFANHADDSMTIISVCLLAGYLATYDYEWVQKKPEKEPFSRPTLKEAGLSTFIMGILTIVLASRLKYMHQTFCLVLMNIM